MDNAEKLFASYEDYPCLDEEDWSNLEFETACAYWQAMGIRERIEWCQRYGCSIFAARRDDIPEDETGELISALAA